MCTSVYKCGKNVYKCVKSVYKYVQVCIEKKLWSSFYLCVRMQTMSLTVNLKFTHPLSLSFSLSVHLSLSLFSFPSPSWGGKSQGKRECKVGSESRKNVIKRRVQYNIVKYFVNIKLLLFRKHSNSDINYGEKYIFW